MAKKPYDHAGADKLDNFVRMKSEYRQQLGIPAMRLYHDLEHFEKKGFGLCQPVTAKYKDLHRITYLSSDSIKKALLALKGTLCEVEIGTPIKGGKKATVVRRYTIAELLSGKASKKIIDYTPEHAQKLASIMNERTFVYGGDLECQPYWNPTRTGRITSAKPPVQNDAEKLRIENLKRGCDKGEVLIYCDIERAEPTVIQHLIDYRFKSDPYKLAMRLLDVSEREAKKQVNMLAYCEYAGRVVKHWPKEAQKIFMPYAEALDAFKAILWKNTKPSGQARRFVTTLGGSRVYAETGGNHSRGTIFNWMVQGTIADITNEAAIRIIDGEEVDGNWSFCFPQHDAVYVIGNETDGSTIASIVEQSAKELGIELKIRVEMF